MSGLCWNVLSNYVNAGARDLMYSAPGPRQAETGRAGWCINTSTHQHIKMEQLPLLISLTDFPIIFGQSRFFFST